MTSTGAATSRGARRKDRDLSALPPRANEWHDRAALLADRKQAVTILHRADLGLRPFLATGTAVGIAALAIILVANLLDPIVSGEDGSGTLVIGALFAMLGIGLSTQQLARAYRRARAVRRRLFAWEDLERTPEARALPAGNIPAELVTPFDARDSSKFDHIARNASIDLQLMHSETPLIARSLLPAAPLLFGFICILAGAVRDYRWPIRLGLVLSGSLLLVTGALGAGKAIQRGWRRSVQSRQLAVEVERWRAERALREPSAPPAPAPGRPVIAMVVVGTLAAGLVGVLVLRIASATPAALAIVGLIATVGATAVGAAIVRSQWRTARLRRRFPPGAADAGVRTVPDPAMAPPPGGHPLTAVTRSRPAHGILLVYADRVALHTTDGRSAVVPVADLLGAVLVPPDYPGGPATLDLLLPDGTHLAMRTRRIRHLRTALEAAGVRVV